MVWLTADEEDEYTVAQANSKLNEDGTFAEEIVMGRHQGNNQEYPSHLVDFVDVSPKQVVAVATACIPFLENDDSNRALMGANMQRQAVPLIDPKAPYVGNPGMEYQKAMIQELQLSPNTTVKLSTLMLIKLKFVVKMVLLMFILFKNSVVQTQRYRL